MSRTVLEQVLELKINEEHEAAEELLHNFIVENAREILADMLAESDGVVEEDLEEIFNIVVESGALKKTKDLEIKLYKVEKDLDEWRNKYYEALQELIEVKAELEKTLINLTHIVHHED